MHFSVPQLANYWFLLRIQTNVLSISGRDTERKAEREQTVFLLFHPTHKLQRYLKYNLGTAKCKMKITKITH